MGRKCPGNLVATNIFWLPENGCRSLSFKSEGIQHSFLMPSAALGGSNERTFQSPKADG